MTRLIAPTEDAPTAGLNVAAKLVPLEGVVPVASPSETSEPFASVILYGLL
jgi:hypothetical protein